MITETHWFLLAFFALLTIVGIESKLGKIADELAILRKSRINLVGDEIPLKVHVTQNEGNG